jgi:hypothetical protein
MSETFFSINDINCDKLKIIIKICAFKYLIISQRLNLGNYDFIINFIPNQLFLNALIF